ncbi:MAG: ATP-binding protein [Actinobacteria bacterium]|nr:ATP-binding protein [Actinomycetota bacterium]
MTTALWMLIVLATLIGGILLGLVLSRRQSAQVVTEPTDQVTAIGNILDVIPDAAAVVDSEDRVLAASSNCVAMGLVVGDRLVPVELRALNREAHRLQKTLGREVSIKRSNTGLGDWDAKLQVSPLDATRALVIAQDLSEERRLNEVRRDFVANVSHELKTPVGALSLLAEAVQAADGDTERARNFAARMQIEVRRLTAMLSDLVELSRVQDDAPLQNSKPILVDAIIAEAVDGTKITAEQRQIEVVVADDIAVGKIFGDESQLVAALRNLISNAIKYSPVGTKVGIGAKRINEFIEISVTDQGPGISEDDQHRVFERFYRVDPARSRETGGTGLGLAIVKHVCANHGGDCFVWSREGEGSTFTLRFPAYLNGNSPTLEVVAS